MTTKTFETGYLEMDNTHAKRIYATPGTDDTDGYEQVSQGYVSTYNALNNTSITHRVTRQQSEPRSYEMLGLQRTNLGDPDLPFRGQPRPDQKRQCILGTVIAVIGLAIITVCCVVPTVVFSGHVDSRIAAEMKLFSDSVFEYPANRSCGYSDPEFSHLRIAINGTCYCLFTEGKTWYKAREFCLFLRGVSYLVEIHDQETNLFLMPFLKAYEPNPEIWIGGSDLNTERVFKWNTSELDVKTFSPTQWDYGEPSHEFKGVPEHCIELSNHKSVTWVTWNDADCNLVKMFLCESIMNTEGRCGC